MELVVAYPRTCPFGQLCSMAMYPVMVKKKIVNESSSYAEGHREDETLTNILLDLPACQKHEFDRTPPLEPVHLL